jgi:hypothetical protein
VSGEIVRIEVLAAPRQVVHARSWSALFGLQFLPRRHESADSRVAGLLSRGRERGCGEVLRTGDARPSGWHLRSEQ